MAGAGNGFAVFDQPGKVVTIEGRLLPPLDRADERDKVRAFLVGTADEVSVAEPLAREESFDRAADDRLTSSMPGASKRSQKRRYESATM